MFVSCVCCVLWQNWSFVDSRPAVCVWVCVCVCTRVRACVVCVCDLGTLTMWWSELLCHSTKKNTDIYTICSNDPRTHSHITKYAYSPNSTKDFINNFNSLFIVVFSLEQNHLCSENYIESWFLIIFSLGLIIIPPNLLNSNNKVFPPTPREKGNKASWWCIMAQEMKGQNYAWQVED